MARTTRQVTSDPASTTEPAAASTRATQTPTTRHTHDGPAREPEHKTYVLDTSVLLSDPRAMLRFAEHEVVLPVVVVTELEGKRHHPELGYFARQALRMLDDLRVSEGRLDKPVAVGTDGGTCGSSSTTPTRRRSRQASGSATTTPASSPWPATSPTRAPT